MNFSINVQTDDSCSIIILKDELSKTEAEIYAFGALLNKFVINGKQNIIDGFESCKDAKDNISNEFKSCKLSPFVCRINKGEYVFQHTKYTTGKFFMAEEALHGLLCDAAFIIKDSGADNAAAFITLEYLYANKNEGFPFEYLCTVTYKLEEKNKLTVSTIVKNNSEKEMPLCDGWHPYFKFDQSINNLLIKLNADKIFEFDNKLLPTGNIYSFTDFQTLQKLDDVFFDNCFLLKDMQQPACTIEDAANNLRLHILPSEDYSYVQLFTPAHRNSIAIESLSAVSDAFNNKIGLLILKPGESKTFVVSFKAEYF